MGSLGRQDITFQGMLLLPDDFKANSSLYKLSKILQNGFRAADFSMTGQTTMTTR